MQRRRDAEPTPSDRIALRLCDSATSAFLSFIYHPTVNTLRSTLLCLLILIFAPGCVSWDPILLPAIDALLNLLP